MLYMRGTFLITGILDLVAYENFITIHVGKNSDILVER